MGIDCSVDGEFENSMTEFENHEMKMNIETLKLKKRDYLSRLDGSRFINQLVSQHAQIDNQKEYSANDLTRIVEKLGNLIDTLRVCKRQLEIKRMVPNDISIAKIRLTELKQKLVYNPY